MNEPAIIVRGGCGKVEPGEIGIILVEHQGQPAFAQNTGTMPICSITADGILTGC